VFGPRRPPDRAATFFICGSPAEGFRIPHGGNVLRAERSPWLAIDPKPLVGEREFDLASLIRDTRERVNEQLVRRRLDLLSELLGLDRERMRCWALVHALAWGVEGDQADAAMIDCARWLARM